MGLLDFFAPTQKTDVVIGDLRYRRRAWHGKFSIPEMNGGKIPLEIQTAKNSDLSCFHPIVNCLRNNAKDIKEQIAEEATRTYEMYVDEDRKARTFTDAEYAQHPTVTGAGDIWHILRPFRIGVTDTASDYNWILYLDVDWPNPHYFVAYLKNDALYQLEVDG